MRPLIKTGLTVGNGAAIDIECGFIPDFAIVYNATDGDLVTAGFVNDQVIPFSGGGTNEIEAGDVIIGATTNARARVKEVLLYSGSWAGGDAAGFLVVSRQDLEDRFGNLATFGSENVYAEDTPSGTDDATVTVNVTHSFASGAAVSGVTGTSALAPYAGTEGSNSKGFTIGSVVAEEAKLLRWIAFRDG